MAQKLAELGEQKEAAARRKLLAENRKIKYEKYLESCFICQMTLYLKSVCLFIGSSNSANMISMKNEELYLSSGVDITNILPLIILVIFMT
jgi:hypothetical protein